MSVTPLEIFTDAPQTDLRFVVTSKSRLLTLTFVVIVCQETVETAGLHSGPSSLFSNSEERNQKKTNIANTKLHMYTISVQTGRRSADNRISSGCWP